MFVIEWNKTIQQDDNRNIHKSISTSRYTKECTEAIKKWWVKNKKSNKKTSSSKNDKMKKCHTLASIEISTKQSKNDTCYCQNNLQKSHRRVLCKKKIVNCSFLCYPKPPQMQVYSLQDIIKYIDKHPDMTRDDLKNLKRDFAKNTKLTRLPSNIQLLRTYQNLVKDSIVEAQPHINKLLKKRSIRSQSWIVSVQVLTKPFWCPWKCIFCPNDFTMPKSYINTEPWAMRALLNNFDPVKQVFNRLLSLTLTWHDTSKIEMIVLGWTRDVYPKDYKEQFIKSLYDAVNWFDEYYKTVVLTKDDDKSYYGIWDDRLEEILVKFPETVQESIFVNETAEKRIIWLTVETRPEYVTDNNCAFWRDLWVTRLEMWVQSTHDDVLVANKRGHSVQQSRDAVHTLRRRWYKFSLHIMPWLYMSDTDKDYQTFVDLYSDDFFKPDEIKFYPTSVIPNTELYDLYKQWEYKALTTDEIKNLVRKVFSNIIPPYTRIKRLIRDIPSTEIVAWSSITNLSQLVRQEIRRDLKSDEAQREALYNKIYPNNKNVNTEEEFVNAVVWLQEGSVVMGEKDVASMREFVSLDTRSREVRNRAGQWQIQGRAKSDVPTPTLSARVYKSSAWREVFLSFEDELGYVYWFTRLLLPEPWMLADVAGLGEKTAIIRELHVYGNVQWVWKKTTDTKDVQHGGFGRRLMTMAESLTKIAWYERLSVIAWVGVKEYYVKQLGYEKEGTYVVKGMGV